MPSQNIISWNELIEGYLQEGHVKQALYCFEHMQSEGILPNVETYCDTLVRIASKIW